MMRYVVVDWETGEFIGATDSLGEAKAWILDDELDGHITDTETKQGRRLNIEIAAKEAREIEYEIDQTLLGFPNEDTDPLEGWK